MKLKHKWRDEVERRARQRGPSERMFCKWLIYYHIKYGGEFPLDLRSDPWNFRCENCGKLDWRVYDHRQPGRICLTCAKGDK